MTGLSETQEKILAVGKVEFLAHGFKGASLRTIVKKAGFTQGAFYGYYPSKEALFEALVAPAADGLIKQFKAAQDAHFNLIPDGLTATSRDLSTEYLLLFMNYVYDNFDAFKLALCCSDGTRFSTYVHDLVALEVNRTERYYSQLRESGKIEGEVDRNLHHIITSAYFTAAFEPVVHDMTRKQAVEYIQQLAIFFNSGWERLLRFT